jgi:predicted DCC family thiol-disulfide oxidoreductase YuxK
LLQHVGQPEDLSTIVMIESVDGGAVRGYTRSTAVLRTLRLLLAPWWLAYWLGVMVPRALRDLVYMQVRVVSRRVAEGAEITRRRHKVRRVVSEHKSVGERPWFWWRRIC